jgi:hypothetical protein
VFEDGQYAVSLLHRSAWRWQWQSILLERFGITKRLSARSQKLAAIPMGIFDAYIRKVIDRGDELLTRQLILHAESRSQAELNRRVGGMRTTIPGELVRVDPDMSAAMPRSLEIIFLLNLEFKPYLVGAGKAAVEGRPNRVIVRRVDTWEINERHGGPLN